jgi:predicted MPP superfamily phosphohydrolase
MNQKLFKLLAQRVDADYLHKRLTRQIERAARYYHKNSLYTFYIESSHLIQRILKFVLTVQGSYKIGIENTTDYKIEKIQISFANLPPQFDGFQILQLSDIHADAIHDSGSKLFSLLKGIKTDVCVITGDYRLLTHQAYEPALKMTGKIVRLIKAEYGTWGILGNHDFIEFVPRLESYGLRMLLNEAVPLKKNGRTIWLVGVDDAHLFGCHDIERATAGVPQNAFSILLSHTPQLYKEAEKSGFDYMICGHTHGGQICLPGGFPVLYNTRAPRKYCSGAWTYRNLNGYTSRGTGASSLPIRFNCPPEITIHEIIRRRS